MIIGITGTIGAGKGTVVEILKEKGYLHFSARDFIVKEIERRGLPVDRDSMTLVGNDLRREHGPAYVIEKLYEEAQKTGKDTVIESIRTTGEIESLRNKPGFSFWAVDALPEIRFKRISTRGTVTDAVSFDEFVRQEQREMESSDPAKQNLSACMKLADWKIENNGSVEELKSKIEEILASIAT